MPPLHPLTQELQNRLEQQANPANAEPMKQYMRNQFEFFGIQSTQRRILFKEFVSCHPLPDPGELLPIVREWWNLPERDFQYCAVELLIKSKKHWGLNDNRHWEYLITHKSWWDTVDYLATKVVGPWFLKYPEKIKPVTRKWNRSNNIWLQRMSILFQLKYKDQTDLPLLFDYINHLSASKEFFVRKAIGWALREYSKTDPKAVKKFLKEQEVSPLSHREAMKHILRKQ